MPRPLTHAISALLAVIGTSAASFAQPIHRLGVMGDSLSNEYNEFPFSYAKSWSQLLVEKRGVSMGPTAMQAGLVDWDDFRNFGFQDNYAHGGSTTDAMVMEGQHTRLAAAIPERRITHVVICPSGNDFAPWNLFIYQQFYYDLWTPERRDAFSDASVANVRALVQAVKPTGARIVLATMPDFSVMPHVHLNFTDTPGQQRVAAAVHRVNEGIRDIARTEGLVLVDLHALTDRIFGTAGARRTSLQIGGVPIAMQVGAGAGDPTAAFVDDRVHFGTAIQSIWANAIITAMNVGYATNLRPFNEREMLLNAGLAYVGPDTLGPELGAINGYVRNFRCPGDFNASGESTVTDIFDFLNAWFASSSEADANADRRLSPEDIFQFLNAWMSGC